MSANLTYGSDEQGWMLSDDFSANMMADDDDNDDDENLIVDVDNGDGSVEYHTTANMSLVTAFTHLVKSNIGAGLLALPQAVSRAGIVFGPIVMFTLSFPIVICILMVVECSKVISKRYKKPIIGYAGTARYAFLPYLKERSKYVCYTINVFLISTQLGVCSTLFLFMAKTLHELTFNMLSDVRIWITILYFVILPISFINDMNCMLLFSIFANLFCLAGFLGTFVAIFGAIDLHQSHPHIKPPSSILLFFTSVMYAYEGIPAVMPLYNKIRNKQKYNQTVILSMAFVVVIMISMGFFGYMAYGEDILPSVTLNIPNTNGYNSVKMIYALGVFLTYFLQFFVATSVILPSIRKRIVDTTKRKYAENFTIFFCVTLTYAAAVAIPQLDNLISLVGAVCCSSLSLVFPPVIYVATFWEEDEHSGRPPVSWFTVVCCVILMIVGAFLSVSGFIITVRKIILDTSTK